MVDVSCGDYCGSLRFFWDQFFDWFEAKFDHVLNGAVGWKQTEKDAGENELVVFRGEDVASKPGLNVVLTLDAVVQSIVETELAAAMVRHSPVSVSAVVVRPKTGEIVAMATLPNFDPNEPGRGNTPLANLRNRAIADQFEPGSTFKAVVISGAHKQIGYSPEKIMAAATRDMASCLPEFSKAKILAS